MNTSRNIDNKEELLAQYRSELGRSWTQDHYEEYLDGSLSQMDTRIPTDQQEESQITDDGLRNEINDDDNRDHSDSTKDWNAENSRTGRHR